MKNVFKFVGITALVAVIGFTAASCSNGTTGGGPFNPGDPGDPGVQRPVVPLKETYVSYDADGNEYKLVITEATGRALGRALDPNKNYTYTLTITFVNGTKATSTGTVVINTDTETDAIVSIDLKHTGTGTTITVTVSGSNDSDTGAITKIKSESGTIPVNSGSTLVPIPTALPYTLNQTDLGGNGYIITNGESFIINGVVNNIPETFRGLPVMGIGWAAFANNKDLRSITIPASITHIAWWGNFEGCTNLATVTFAAGSKLEHIGGGAFTDCTSLTSITIPASVIVFGNLAGEGWGTFANCENLTTITFTPNSKLEIIGNGTFFGCTSLTSITIPAGVTSIGNGVFYECKSLKTVTFEPGSKLKTIGIWAFRFTGLTSIEIPASVTSIGIGDGGWEGAFSSCENLTTITFAEGSQLETIGDSFSWCTNLATVTFGSGSKLKTIGKAAFWERGNLTSITIPASVTSIGEGAFGGWTFSQTINVYHASRTAANAAWGDAWWSGCGAVIKYWNGSAFVEPGLEYELTDDGAGYRVVYGPRSGVVNIPATYNGKPVTFISVGAFQDTGITGITFAPGSQLETIGYGAFARCYNLTSITIPANVMWIDVSFPGCENLKTITVDAGNPNYTSEGGILYNKDKTVLEAYPSASGNVTIPPGVTVIGNGAFRECKITGITIPAEVESILSHAFIGCTNINSITIPTTVTYMSDVLFEAWTSAQTINIEGHANRASTIATGWSDIWDKNCDAKIIYGQ